ncbi:hypothetical protein ACXR0O_03800 [Verrucomicrobiota bacterium sgz303538]
MVLPAERWMLIAEGLFHSVWQSFLLRNGMTIPKEEPTFATNGLSAPEEAIGAIYVVFKLSSRDIS